MILSEHWASAGRDDLSERLVYGMDVLILSGLFASGGDDSISAPVIRT